MRDDRDLDVLRELRPPATGPGADVVARERAALMAHIGAAPLAARSRRRLLWRAGAGVALAGTLAAACWVAVARRDPALTTRIECADVGTIDVRTGNPVADCAAAWRAAHGAEPPPLAAYTDASGATVHVLDAGQEPPDGWVPLRPDFRQDVAIRELDDELADVGRGLSARCFTEPEAVALVRDQLARLDLERWTVRTASPGPGEPDSGPEVCATYIHFVDPEENPREVVIRAIGEGGPRGLRQERQLARSLDDRMVAGPDHRCLSLDEALAVARAEAERLGFDVDGPEIEFEILPASSPAGPTCARPTTRVGGLVHVTLRQVPAAQP